MLLFGESNSALTGGLLCVVLTATQIIRLQIACVVLAVLGGAVVVLDFEIAIVQQSSAPDGVVCVFADLAYLRAFGADLLRSFGEAHRRSQIGLHVHLPDHRRRSR